MFSRGLACSLVLGMASIAHAGAVVTLVPQSSAPYAPDSTVRVNVMLQQTPAGSDIQLRHVQLDFGASDLAAGQLQLIGPQTHGLANATRFFVFTEAGGNCTAGTEAACGSGHFIDGHFTLPVGRERVVSMTYFFTDPNVLTVNPTAQRMLPASAQIQIGALDVRMPNNATPACYTLDALNSAQANPDLGGAELRFGFGTDVGGIPLTTWRVGNPAATAITGASIEMCIGTGGGCTQPNVVKWESVQAHARGVGDVAIELNANNLTSEPRSGARLIRVTFDGPVNPATAVAGNISIVGRDVNGAAVNLGATVLTPTLASGDTVLNIAINPPLPDYARYCVTLNGVGCPSPVVVNKRGFTALLGDANNDRRITAQDVGGIRSLVGIDPINPAVSAQVRSDANRDGRITAQDVGGARSLIPNDARNITDPCN